MRYNPSAQLPGYKLYLGVAYMYTRAQDSRKHVWARPLSIN